MPRVEGDKMVGRGVTKLLVRARKKLGDDVNENDTN